MDFLLIGGFCALVVVVVFALGKYQVRKVRRQNKLGQDLADSSSGVREEGALAEKREPAILDLHESDPHPIAVKTAAHVSKEFSNEFNKASPVPAMQNRAARWVEHSHIDPAKEAALAAKQVMAHTLDTDPPIRLGEISLPQLAPLPEIELESEPVTAQQTRLPHSASRVSSQELPNHGLLNQEALQTAIISADGATDLAKTPPQDARIHALIQVQLPEPEALLEARELCQYFKSRLESISAYDFLGDTWVSLSHPETPILARGQTQKLSFARLLSNRSGPVGLEELQDWQARVQQVANTLNAQCSDLQLDKEIKRAVALDTFCARHDVLLAVNFERSDVSVGGIKGTLLRGVLQAQGFSLNSSGEFLLFAEQGQLLYRVLQLDGSSFNVEQLRHGEVKGFSLLFDVLLQANPLAAFEQLRVLIKNLNKPFHTQAYDDSNKFLDDAALMQMRQTIEAKVKEMNDISIPCGSRAALLLFAY
ncbi:MAG: hypothetical protein RLZZ502_883 [Pseudomonadota bacterium]|jgi:hypothetical protein